MLIAKSATMNHPNQSVFQRSEPQRGEVESHSHRPVHPKNGASIPIPSCLLGTTHDKFLPQTARQKAEPVLST